MAVVLAWLALGGDFALRVRGDDPAQLVVLRDATGQKLVVPACRQANQDRA
ncbi:hypothetical protein OAX78_02030 [Planctomycetota bacterium]|nr:hypothetical protein [Planctomycetota bacterium]